MFQNSHQCVNAFEKSWKLWNSQWVNTSNLNFIWWRKVVLESGEANHGCFSFGWVTKNAVFLKIETWMTTISPRNRVLSIFSLIWTEKNNLFWRRAPVVQVLEKRRVLFAWRDYCSKVRGASTGKNFCSQHFNRETYCSKVRGSSTGKTTAHKGYYCSKIHRKNYCSHHRENTEGDESLHRKTTAHKGREHGFFSFLKISAKFPAEPSDYKGTLCNPKFRLLSYGTSCGNF